MTMDLGPVQLLVFGFERPRFGGRIAAELNRLKEQDLIRVIDALVVHKNAEGEVRDIQVTDLSPTESERFGAIIGGLIGLGAGGPETARAAAEAGMQMISDRGGHVFDPAEWDVLEDIPPDTAAALVLLEHRWAIPLRDTIREEGGVAIGDLWLHPRDLVAAGLLAAEALEEAERGRAA
jgi:uncharacterized membrane protein